MVSWRARAMIAGMWLRRNKQFYADPGVMRRELPRHQAPERSRPPRYIVDGYDVTNCRIDGHDVYTIAPSGGPTSPWRIFHMHGGGFVEAPEPHHWHFAARLVERLGCTYCLPMYPLSLELDDRDPELGVTGLKQAGRWFAAGRALDDPHLSPAFADLTGLAPIVVFIGHRDILLPDARRIKELGDTAGVPVDLHEYPGMVHNWIMKNIPEARRAIDELLEFLHTVEKGADFDRQDNR